MGPICLASAVTGTSAARDAMESLQIAIDEAEGLLGQELIADRADPTTGEIVPLTIVTDNGPAFKSLDFLRFFARHSDLRHVRTRHHAPETNGVV